MHSATTKAALAAALVIATAPASLYPMAMTPSTTDASGPSVGGISIGISDSNRSVPPPASAIQASNVRGVINPRIWRPLFATATASAIGCGPRRCPGFCCAPMS